MTAAAFLDFVNSELHRLHHEYETLFWDSYMGIRKVGQAKDKALAQLDAFRGSVEHKERAQALAQKATGDTKARLLTWVRFFELYQVPAEAVTLRDKINQLETEILQKRTAVVEGYIDPKTKAFVLASTLKMRSMMQTHTDERVRRACFTAREALAKVCLTEYVTLVKLRNDFAQLLGYADFYDYKLRHIDQMTKNELFGIFDKITVAAQPHLEFIRALEKTKPGLRQPWNFHYLTTGDFTRQEDQYYPFTEAVPRWLESFGKLGVTFGGGSLQLDLVERKGKYNNGFCHWPTLVRFQNNKRLPGVANFTCNITPKQVGSGALAYKTLFHEGGHAAHFLNTTQHEVCLNHEYAPMTAAWAETQSMFMDTMFASPEWHSRYAKNEAGEVYPFALYEEKVRATALLKPRDIMSIIFIATFERRVYEEQSPTEAKIMKIAKTVCREIFDFSTDSLLALNTPHIYSWQNACAYHGYGLAQVALHQWRDYFHQKYGYIVDNPAVGKEMKTAWSWGARYDFKTAVKHATGQKLSPTAFIRHITRKPEVVISEAKKRIEFLSTIKTKAVKLDADITMVHGKKVIADATAGVAAMAKTYKHWYQKLN